MRQLLACFAGETFGICGALSHDYIKITQASGLGTVGDPNLALEVITANRGSGDLFTHSQSQPRPAIGVLQRRYDKEIAAPLTSRAQDFQIPPGLDAARFNGVDSSAIDRHVTGKLKRCCYFPLYR